MPQSLTQVWRHIVFSTKNRKPFLQDHTFRTEMFRMLAHHVKESGCTSASVGGHVGHVHLLVGLSRTFAISKLIEKTKIETSKWAKSCDDGSTMFSWQAGYGAFSVSHSKTGEVDQYIRNQDEHHAGAFVPRRVSQTVQTSWNRIGRKIRLGLIQFVIRIGCDANGRTFGPRTSFSTLVPGILPGLDNDWPFGPTTALAIVVSQL